MDINKDTLEAFRADMHEALVALEKKYHMTATVKTITFGDNDLHFTTEFVNNISADGRHRPQILWDDALARYPGKYWGFKSSDLGREFKLNGKQYKITEALPRGRKYTIAATECIANGKSYRFAAADVMASFKQMLHVTKLPELDAFFAEEK